MVSELKLIMKADEDGVIMSHKTKIFVDDEVIGCIQSIKIEIGVDSIPKIEITFPDLNSKSIDKDFDTTFRRIIPMHIAQLSKFSNVSIVLKEIFGEMDDEEPLHEVSTDGVIEYIKVHTE